MQHLLVRTSRRRLLESPDWKVNSLGRDYSHRYGYGLIDAGALVELASVWVSVPEQRNQTVLYNGGKSHSFTDKLIAQIEFLPNSYPLNIDKLEHVIIIASISFQPRGNLRLRLVSPHGTESIILEKRPQDYSSKGFDKFEFLSVHFWDERYDSYTVCMTHIYYVIKSLWKLDIPRREYWIIGIISYRKYFKFGNSNSWKRI